MLLSTPDCVQISAQRSLQPPACGIEQRFRSELKAQGRSAAARVQGRIQTALAKNMVEPKRKFTDTTRVWDKFRAKKSGGPGGMLQLTLVQARELRCGGSQGVSAKGTLRAVSADRLQGVGPSPQCLVVYRIFSEALLFMKPSTQAKAPRSLTPSPQLAHPGGCAGAARYAGSGMKLTQVDPYVEVRAGAEVFRTPTVHQSHAPAWNWDFDLRLPAPIGSPGAVDVLRCPTWPI